VAPLSEDVDERAGVLVRQPCGVVELGDDFHWDGDVERGQVVVELLRRARADSFAAV